MSIALDPLYLQAPGVVCAAGRDLDELRDAVFAAAPSGVAVNHAVWPGHALHLGAVRAVCEQGRQRRRVCAGAERLFHTHEERTDSVGGLRRGRRRPPRHHDDEAPHAGSHGDGPGPTDRQSWLTPDSRPQRTGGPNLAWDDVTGW